MNQYISEHLHWLDQVIGLPVLILLIIPFMWSIFRFHAWTSATSVGMKANIWAAICVGVLVFVGIPLFFAVIKYLFNTQYPIGQFDYLIQRKLGFFTDNLIQNSDSVERSVIIGIWLLLAWKFLFTITLKLRNLACLSDTGGNMRKAILGVSPEDGEMSVGTAVAMGERIRIHHHFNRACISYRDLSNIEHMRRVATRVINSKGS